jgi:formylglycine-generating enzyme required for sulfatase activity
MKLRLIPAGTFTMGSPKGEAGRLDDEEAHEVEITRPFYLGVHEVTVGEFGEFVSATRYQTDAEKSGRAGLVNNPNSAAPREYDGARFNWRDPGWPDWKQTDRHPATLLSWQDAVEFCRWLSTKEGKTYRLPTEAEWEYACRAGSKTRFQGGNGEVGLLKLGNVADGSLKAVLARATPRLLSDWTFVTGSDGHVFTAPAGQFDKNAWGLCDLHGNVFEWCQDWYEKDYYRRSPRTDPAGPPNGQYKVLRGGSWAQAGNKCRAAYRHYWVPGAAPTNENGFRVVLEVDR